MTLFEVGLPVLTRRGRIVRVLKIKQTPHALGREKERNPPRRAGF